MDAPEKDAAGEQPTAEHAEDLAAFWASLDDEALLLDEDFIQKVLKGEDEIDLPEDFFLDGEAPLEVTPEERQEEPALTEEEEQALARKALEEFRDQEQKRESLYVRIKQMSVGQKIKVALKGGREARNILIRDANKLIKRLVLRNPRISEDEIVMVARNKSEESEFLDYIAKRKEWMASYQVRLALVTNPKTPAPIALRIVNTLMDRDLRQIAKSKNVPALVSSAAKRLLLKRQGE